MAAEDTTANATYGADGFHVVVHQDRCIGAGHCVANAQGVFGQDGDSGLVFLKQEAPLPDQRDAVRVAAELCPVAAIEIRE